MGVLDSGLPVVLGIAVLGIAIFATLEIRRRTATVRVARDVREECGLTDREFLELWRHRIVRGDGTLRDGVHIARAATLLTRLRGEE